MDRTANIFIRNPFMMLDALFIIELNQSYRPSLLYSEGSEYPVIYRSCWQAYVKYEVGVCLLSLQSNTTLARPFHTCERKEAPANGNRFLPRAITA